MKRKRLIAVVVTLMIVFVILFLILIAELISDGIVTLFSLPILGQ